MDLQSHQAPLSKEFSWQEYWGRLSFPTPGDLLNPGIEPVSLASPASADRLFTTGATWEAQHFCHLHFCHLQTQFLSLCPLVINPFSRPPAFLGNQSSIFCHYILHYIFYNFTLMESHTTCALLPLVSFSIALSLIFMRVFPFGCGKEHYDISAAVFAEA